MGKSFSESYKEAGVDITAGYKAVELMKEHVAKTMIFGNVPEDIGGFGGLCELDLTGIEKPVLVSGTDGVGTKLKMAFLMDKHDTVGIDCVAMCVNDIICCGALWQEIADHFGTDAVFLNKQDYYGSQLKVRIHTTASQMRFFVMTHLNDCEVTGPRRFREEIQHAVREAYKKYWQA